MLATDDLRIHLRTVPSPGFDTRKEGICMKQRMDPSRGDTRKPFPPGPEWEQMDVIILGSK